MNAIANPGTVPMKMTSREIADLTGKRHDNVMADIRRMLVELHGQEGLLKFQDTHVNPQNGQEYASFSLPKRETLILVSGYSVQMRARIIDRWQELESGVAQIPKSLPEALRLAADMAEQKAQVEAALAVAAPKAIALDRISASDEAVTITQAAKVLGIKRERLTNFLHAAGWIYRQNGAWVAYDQHIRNGRLQFKEARYTDESTGQECHRPYCHILPKGLAYLARHFAANETATA